MKLKRILALILCFAMVFSTMSFNVFAEDITLGGDLDLSGQGGSSEGGSSEETDAVFTVTCGVFEAQNVNTLEAALNAFDLWSANMGILGYPVITLNEDYKITESVEVDADYPITIDLNGNTINSVFDGTSTTNHIYCITNNGTLTIKDSGENGEINSRGIYNYGTLTLESGTVNSIDGNGGYAINNKAGSTFIMNGGVVATTLEDDHQNSSGGYDATPVNVPAGATATLNGGEITNVCDFTFGVTTSGTLNIPADSTIEISGYHGAIAVQGGETTIDAGTFVIPKDEYARTDNVVYVEGGSLVINGGTFTGDSDTASGGSCVCDTAGTAVINGGNFSGSSGGDVWGTVGTTIKGGAFDNLTETEHIADGYKLDEDGNVVEGTPSEGGEEDTTYVAKVGEVGYATLAEAAAAAKSGDTITLLADAAIAENTDVTIPGGVTLNGNGYSILASGADHDTDTSYGYVVAGGNLTIEGITKIEKFSASYYNHIITIGEGASLEVFGKNRVSVGYGSGFYVTGSITDAKTANKSEIQPSLNIPAGLSIVGADDTVFEVKNAYVILGGTTSKNSNAAGKFDISFENSIVEFTNQFSFSAPKYDTLNPVFNVNIEDSVVTTATKLMIAAPGTVMTVDNSDIELGTYLRNSGEIVLKNGSSLTGAMIQYGENGGNDGKIVVDNSTFTIVNNNTAYAMDGKGVGSLTLKNGAVATIDYIRDSFYSVDDTSTLSVKELINCKEQKNAVAKIGDVEYETLAEAIAAAVEGDTITILAGTISEGTIKLPATMKNVTIKGEEGAILKDMTISAADGNSYSYVGLTFDGIVFDNSRLLFTGWRNGDEIIENLTVTNCTFKNLNDDSNMAAVHINKEVSEPVNGFTFTNNVIDGATGGSKSGIYSANTGNVTITGNTFNNIVFRPALVQLADCDGVNDNINVSNNVISNTTRLQIYGSEEGPSGGPWTPSGTDTLEIAINENIFKNISGQYICTWGINGETDISKNYYDATDLGGRIYWNNESPANEAGLAEIGIYPIYTELNEDGTINEESLYTPATIIANAMDANGVVVGSYSDFESAIAAISANEEIARIEIVSDYEQTTIVNTENYNDITRAITIGAPEGEEYTVTVNVTGDSIALRVIAGGSLTIEDNVTIEGLDVVANGFATTGENMTINGTLKALSLKQWTNNGTITVNETGSVWLGYGDGQFDLAYGNGTVTVNGNGDKTTAQFKAGYSGTRGNGNTLNLNNTYFEAGAWFNVDGSNGTINADNSVLKVSGGDATGKLTINSTGNVINLTNGSELHVGILTIGENNTVTLGAGSSINATTISGAGKIVIDATGMTTGTIASINGNATDFTGTIEVVNNDNLSAEIDENGNIVLIENVVPVAKIGDTTYATLAEAVEAANDDDTITLISDVEMTDPVVISGKSLTLDLGEYTICDKSTRVITSKDDIWGLISLENSAKLTICGNGKIECKYTEVTGGWTGMAFCINVDATSELTVNGGNFINGNGGIQTSGKVTVNDGTFVSHNGGTCIMAVASSANVTVNDGTFKDSVEESDIYTGSGAVWSGFGATVTINGGYYDFEADPSNDNIVWTLFPAQNAISGMQGQNANMTVNGGTFVNFNPATDVVIDYSASEGFTYGSVVADGCAALESMDGKFFVGTKPTATVNDLGKLNVTEYSVWNGSLVEGTGEMPLNFVMQFVADQDEEDMETSPYSDWYADFVITVSGLKNGSFVADGCYLAGYYDPFGWVKVPIDGMKIEDGVRYPVMLGVGLGQKYEYICSGVKDFRCAMFLTEEVLEQNPDLKVNLELAVVDNSEGADAATAALQDKDSSKVLKVESIEYTAEDFEILDYVAQIGDDKYTSLEEALNAAVVAGGEVTVTLLDNIDLTGKTWTPIYFNSYNGANANTIVLDGAGYTITGLSDMLFSGVWTGTKLEVKNLTIDKAVIKHDVEDNENVGVGAIVGNVSAVKELVIDNCKLTNSHVEGGHWTGGFVGYAAGYSGNDGPVFTEIFVTNSEVSNSEIVGKGSVGAIVGHATGDAWTSFDVASTIITGNTITSTGSSTNKAGIVMGTIGAAGTDKTTNGTTLTGGVSVAVTESNNTATSNGTVITTVYGRQGSTTGVLTITGGEYANMPIETSASYAKVVEGYELVQNTTGTYTLAEANYVAAIGDDKYTSLQDAINAANGRTVTVIKDIDLGSTTVTIPAGVAMTLDLNGKTISGECNASQAHMIMVAYGADLTIDDSSAEQTGKITYAEGTSNVGWTIDVEGDLVLESGTIELTGEWSIGYAVDVRPNAWGVAYTEPTTFVMNNGKVVSSDGAVRVASSSSETYPKVAASFTMNGGEIDAAWDGVFVQQSNAAWDTLTFTINNGTIKSGLNPVRFYGPAATSYVNGEDCVDIELNGGTLTYTGTEERTWLVDNILRLGGGITEDDFLKDTTVTASESFAQANVAEGYKWVESDGVYTLEKDEPATELFKFVEISASLDSSLALNIFLNSSDLTGEDYYAVIEHTKATGDVITTNIPYSKWETRKERKLIRYTGIAAKEMADKIKITVYNADGTQASIAQNTSLRDYAIGMLNLCSQDSANARWLPVYVDMLNYGAAAQTVFNYNTSDLASKGAEDFQVHASPDYTLDKDGCYAEGNAAEVSLTLEEMIKLNVYFKNVTENMYAVYSYTTHGGTSIEQRVEYDSFISYSKYLGVPVEIAVADAATLVTVTMFNSDNTEAGKVVYSVNGYLKGMIDNGATDEIYPALAKFAASAKKAFAAD